MQYSWFEYKNYAWLKLMYERRGLPPVSWADLPQIGIVVEGCAALFMYMTDGDFVFLEGAITDPKADKRLRTAALGCAIEQLIKKAKKMGFKKALGFTQLPSMVRLTKQLGWTDIDKPYTMVIKAIE